MSIAAKMMGRQEICSSVCAGITNNLTTTTPTICRNDLRNALQLCLDCYSAAGQTPPNDIQTLNSSLKSCITSASSSTVSVSSSASSSTQTSSPLLLVSQAPPVSNETITPILGGIIGGIVSGLVCLIVLGTVLYLFRRAQRRHSPIEAGLPVEPEMESVGPKITGTNRHQRLSATPWTDPALAPPRPRPVLVRGRGIGGMYGHRSDSHLPLLVAGERKIRTSASHSALSDQTSYAPSGQTSTEPTTPMYQVPRSASASTFKSASMTSICTTPAEASTPPPYMSPRRAASAVSLAESHDDWSMGIGNALSMKEARRSRAVVRDTTFGRAPITTEDTVHHRAVEEGPSRIRGVGTSSSSLNELTGSAVVGGTQAQTRAQRKLHRPRTPQKQRSVDLL